MSFIAMVRYGKSKTPDAMKQLLDNYGIDQNHFNKIPGLTKKEIEAIEKMSKKLDL